MGQTITLGEPVTVGLRIIFPVIRDETVCLATGVVAERDPVALIISDNDRWFFAPLAAGISQDIVTDLLV